MGTSATPPLSEDMSQFCKKEDLTSLLARFEKLKGETESLLNKMAEDGHKLQGETQKLADQVLDLTKKLNLAIDEIRSIGGKRLEKTDPAPVEKVRRGLGVTMFDFFEDDEEADNG